MFQPQEQLYDITDLQSEQESSLISKCGHIEVAFAYDAPTRKMTVRVLQARDVPTKERGGSQNTQVRCKGNTKGPQCIVISSLFLVSYRRCRSPERKSSFPLIGNLSFQQF